MQSADEASISGGEIVTTFRQWTSINKINRVILANEAINVEKKSRDRDTSILDIINILQARFPFLLKLLN